MEKNPRMILERLESFEYMSETEWRYWECRRKWIEANYYRPLTTFRMDDPCATRDLRDVRGIPIEDLLYFYVSESIQ